VPFLLFVGAATALLVTSVGLAVWDDTASTRARERESNGTAHRRAVALAEYRGQLISVWLDGGKSSTGVIVTCDPELLILLIDIRKPRRVNGVAEFSRDPPSPNDLAEISLEDVTRVEVYLEGEAGD